MRRMTSIKLPVSAAVERDSEGFRSESIAWQDAIPATVREATRREQAMANQAGYTISQIYEIRFYEDQDVLMDEADGQIYDIRQVTISGAGFALDCTRRAPGRGY